MTHDWNLSKRIKCAIQPKPLILAGGLTQNNVKDAVQTVQPYAVDVSTGVETKGRKDPIKIRDFIQSVRLIK